MTMPSAPVPLGPSSPRWSPGWVGVDPQASAGALPWRVLRVICPPIVGSRQHGHLRVASQPRHQAALAARSPPPAPLPPLRSANSMAGLSLPLPRPHALPPAQGRFVKLATRASAALWPPARRCLPAPTHSWSLPHLPCWYRQRDLSCLFT